MRAVRSTVLLAAALVLASAPAVLAGPAAGLPSLDDRSGQTQPPFGRSDSLPDCLAPAS